MIIKNNYKNDNYFSEINSEDFNEKIRKKIDNYYISILENFLNDKYMLESIQDKIEPNFNLSKYYENKITDFLKNKEKYSEKEINNLINLIFSLEKSNYHPSNRITIQIKNKTLLQEFFYELGNYIFDNEDIDLPLRLYYKSLGNTYFEKNSIKFSAITLDCRG